MPNVSHKKDNSTPNCMLNKFFDKNNFIFTLF
jgi:hypothetical protein